METKQRSPSKFKKVSKMYNLNTLLEINKLDI